jgi:branched-chain amino acid transport system substrate-binding protein
MMSSRSRNRALSAVALVAIGVMAGTSCLGRAASGPKPIRIGALVPDTSFGLSYYPAAFRAAVRNVNAHGGIRGRPIQVEICDDANDPNQAQACARRLVSDGVLATASNISGLSMVEGPILDEAGIPQVGSEAINPEDSYLPTAFPLDGGLFVQLAGGIVGMKRRGVHSLYTVTLDVPGGRTVVGLAAELARAGDVQPAGASFVPSAASDMTPYVQAAMQSKAGVVFPALPPALMIPFLIASRLAGARYVVMIPYGGFRPVDIAAMGGREAVTENDIEFAAVPALSATDRFPALRMFASDMDAELAAGDRSAAPDRRTGGSLDAWLSVMIIAREASTLDTVDAAHLLRDLHTKPVVDTMGLTPPWSPGRTGLASQPRVTNLYGYLTTQRNGVEVLADPAPLNPFTVLKLAG